MYTLNLKTIRKLDAARKLAEKAYDKAVDAEYHRLEKEIARVERVMEPLEAKLKKIGTGSPEGKALAKRLRALEREEDHLSDLEFRLCDNY